MIGARIGAKIGVVVGAAVGSGVDELGGGIASTTQTVSVADNASGSVITGADPFAYTVRYTNTGAANAISVSVAVTLDASLTYVSASGTGWSISRVGQVVTCTRAVAAAGAAPAITVNVATGGSATTAHTTAAATATNASTANGSHDVTVNLVTQDATALKYFPANATEWTNFITRKGLGISNPSLLWNCQELSGNTTDAIGSFTGTATGTGLSYNNAVAGYSRKSINTTDGSTGRFVNSSASLPSLATQSMLVLAVINPTTITTANRTLLSMGVTTVAEAEISTTPRVRAVFGATATLGTADPHNAVRPWVLKHDKTNSAQAVYTDQEKVSGAFTALAGQAIKMGEGAGSSATAEFLYCTAFFTSAAELTDAQVRSLLQALGWTVAW